MASTAAVPAAEAILAALRERDRLDSTRAVAPLHPAPDARIIATDGNRFEDTVDAVVGAILDAQARRAAEPQSSGTRGDREGARARAADDRHARATQPPIDSSITPLISAAHVRWPDLRPGDHPRLDRRRRSTSCPRTGPLIIAANHASNLDVPIIGAWLIPRLGRRIHWLGKKELFDWPIIGWVAANGGVHPVDRGAADVEAFRLAQRILDQGHVLFVFPEGTRSPDGALQEARDGIALLALRTGAPVVPVGIAGSNGVWPKGQRLPHPGGRVTGPGRAGVPSGRRAPAGHGPAGRQAADDEPDHAAHRRAPAARQRGVYGDRPAG